jgi:hypothetical protein
MDNGCEKMGKLSLRLRQLVIVKDASRDDWRSQSEDRLPPRALASAKREMGPEIVALTYQDRLPQFQRYNYILDHQSFYQDRYGYVQARKRPVSGKSWPQQSWSPQFGAQLRNA